MDYVAPDNHELAYQAWSKHINSVTSTAMGRVFDAMAALSGICEHASFEGQGPMYLEAMAVKNETGYIECPLQKQEKLWRADWQPLLSMMQDMRVAAEIRAAVFHNSMAQLMLALAQQLRQERDFDEILLSGGVFQNRLLAETGIRILQQQGFKTCLPHSVPVNDAGISFGQVMEYAFLDNKVKHAG